MSDLVSVRLRWPFIAALTAAVLAAPAAFAVPAVAHWWHDRSQGHPFTVDQARFQRQYGRTMAALGQMNMPAAFTTCGRWSTQPMHNRCWTSERVLVRPATRAVKNALSALGATNLQGTCTQHGPLLLCRVTGSLEGQQVAARIGPQMNYRPQGKSTFHGSRVAVGLPAAGM